MKITKFVVIGQLVASAGLLGAFALKGSGSHAVAASTAHAPEAAAGKPTPTPGEHGEGAKAGHGEAEHDADDSGAEKPAHGPIAMASGAHGPAAKAAGGHGDDHGSENPGLGVDAKAIAKALLDGNTRFTAGERRPDLARQRVASAAGQHPGAMVLGCADSRVPPELVFDRGIGELFVVRSAGNIAEPVAVGSLEYAHEHLHTKVLLVLGHEKCGAVQAALAEGKMPTPNLEAIVSHIAPAVGGLKSWAEGPELVRMAVEANVRRQADEILKRSPLLRAAVAKGEVKLLKAVYDMETGRVRPL